jgi:putative colanic acid biosysnthesis UDP-glucose lipid carrier transferase
MNVKLEKETGSRTDVGRAYLRPLITSHLTAIYTITDAITILAALYVSTLLAGTGPHDDTITLAYSTGTLLFVLIASRHGLYRSWRVTPVLSELRQVVSSWGITSAFLSLGALMGGYTQDLADMPALALWLVLAPVALSLQRIVVRHAFRAVRMAGRNYRVAAVVGNTASAAQVVDTINRSSWMGLRLLGVFDDRLTPREEQGVSGRPLGTFEELLAAAHRSEVDVIYLALPLRAVERIRSQMMQLMDTTASVYLVPDFLEFGLMESQIAYLGDIPTLTVSESPFNGVEGWTKQVSDVLLAFVILLLIALPMLVIAIGIKLTSPGPVIFRQRRYGLNGKPIEVWKFRSMSVAEDGQNTFRQATRNDSRVTPFGAFLRRTSLDELPQFINVLQGSMSIVGPRPHPVALNESFRSLIPGYMLRHKVKPGITGWAQINGWRGETDTLEKMAKRIEFDIEYVRRWSLFFDLKIIFLTVFRVLKDRHAY